MNGFVDYIGQEMVRGWCVGEVELIVDRRFVLDPSVRVDRQDLKDAGIDSSGFEFHIATEIPGYIPTELIVRPRGKLLPLPGGYLRTGGLRPFQYVQSNAKARENNDRLMEGATRGVCLFTSRSGSTMLSDLIRSHPNAYAFSEPVENFVRGGKSAFSEWLEDFFIVPNRIEYPCKIEDPRLMFMTTKISQSDSDLFHMFNRYNVKYIRLYRENILKQALSHIVSANLHKERNNFNLKSGDEAEYRRSRQKVIVDPGALISCMENFCVSERIVDSMISTYAQGDIISVSYEKLLDGGIKKIFDYFDLPWCEVHTDFVKINSEDISEIIDNYDVVEKYMRGTRFYHLI